MKFVITKLKIFVLYYEYNRKVMEHPNFWFSHKFIIFKLTIILYS
jgi:hypothetical protein